MLREELRRRLLEERGITPIEACDKCGQVLGAVRFTRRAELGAFCSQQCRDGKKAHTSPVAPGQADTVKAGRAKVKASEKHSETFRFMTTKEESAKIRANAKAAGITVSEYLRRVALQRNDLDGTARLCIQKGFLVVFAVQAQRHRHCRWRAEAGTEAEMREAGRPTTATGTVVILMSWCTRKWPPSAKLPSVPNRAGCSPAMLRKRTFPTCNAPRNRPPVPERKPAGCGISGPGWRSTPSATSPGLVCMGCSWTWLIPTASMSGVCRKCAPSYYGMLNYAVCTGEFPGQRRNPVEDVILPEVETKSEPTVAATREHVSAIRKALKGLPLERAALALWRSQAHLPAKPAVCGGKSGTARRATSTSSAPSGTSTSGPPRLSRASDS